MRRANFGTPLSSLFKIDNDISRYGPGDIQRIPHHFYPWTGLAFCLGAQEIPPGTGEPLPVFLDKFIGSKVFDGAVKTHHIIDLIAPVIFTGIEIGLLFRDFFGDIQVFSVGKILLS